MSQENVAVIRRLYERLAAGDVAGVLASLSPDIVWREAERLPMRIATPTTGPRRSRPACSPAASANGTALAP
jgi:ketosteroid isomerase-like protein